MFSAKNIKNINYKECKEYTFFKYTKKKSERLTLIKDHLTTLVSID